MNAMSISTRNAHLQPASRYERRSDRDKLTGRLTAQVQFQQAGQDLAVGEVRGPAVGGEDGFVQGFVGQSKPSGRVVVEVGESALSELGRAYGSGGFSQPSRRLSRRWAAADMLASLSGVGSGNGNVSNVEVGV